MGAEFAPGWWLPLFVLWLLACGIGIYQTVKDVEDTDE